MASLRSPWARPAPAGGPGTVWRQARRRENLQSWDIDTAAGERLLETFAALATHAVAADASLTATELEDLPLKTVAEAATGKRDYELLAGLPQTFDSVRDADAVNVFRLHVYRGGPSGLRITRLATELRHSILVLAEHGPARLRTCGDVLLRAPKAACRNEAEGNFRGVRVHRAVGAIKAVRGGLAAAQQDGDGAPARFTVKEMQVQSGHAQRRLVR
ncbi:MULTISPECIES: hypothetical protein [Streptomyces]|uniref:Uncharacterized protein n=1 Tax=Streptomyces doudnae TaxID=3075536 RepID=A0ABD5EVE5_9ACTN|nr:MULTISPECIES: hypothetical protein [unclassified Streptomyces]MDT0438668.1 hypothetical protein [Streptomyces sp. DSM 41981]MYQ62028.1 hypothetical protein [Streptomyces sp. SID4950]SCD28733.1 hypothetical protein GA0115242_100712 [Streptomyces sp. SolWspMP-5a-2]